tara:strand:+ start:102 stop:401 length:300 start_codon:yes stop_codon:yes gene_type:complete
MDDISEETFDEIKRLISLRKITICETCDNIFPYVPQKKFCDECRKERDDERKETKNRKAREYRKENYERVRAIERRSIVKNREKRNARARERYRTSKEK